ncbi:MAG: hypothetical protein MI742_07990, partial [Desulfobacterales bacterium]|nr:hypothetical protein [Desulfobacterales bacterium]
TLQPKAVAHSHENEEKLPTHFQFRSLKIRHNKMAFSHFSRFITKKHRAIAVSLVVLSFVITRGRCQ